MPKGFKDTWVRQDLKDEEAVAKYIAACPQGRVHYFQRIQEVRVDADALAEKITNGKKVLVLDRKSGSWLGRFVNYDRGAICPSFRKMTLGTNCAFSCEFCFLQGTYRGIRPFVCVYVPDWDQLERDLKRLGANGTSPVINAGEMSDPLAGDVLGYAPKLVELFGRLGGPRLLMLTKSGVEEVEPILSSRHRRRTILAWSINCAEAVAKHEHGAASLHNRLKAASEAQAEGYEVRLRLDPMLIFPGWEEAYARTVDTVYQAGLRPERFTLGSFRLLGNLRHIIAARFPNSDLLTQPLVKERGKRMRYPHEAREALYRLALDGIRRYDENVPVALCKETPEMHRALKGLVDPKRCNCAS